MSDEGAVTETAAPDSAAEVVESTLDSSSVDVGGGSETSSADAEYRAAMKEAGVQMMDDPADEDIPDVDKMNAEADEEHSSLDKQTTDGKKEESEKPEENEITPQTDEPPTPEQEADLKEAFEMTLKLGDESKTYTSAEEIQKLAQHGLGANKKMQEAAGIRKQAENLIQALKDDPFKALGHESLGLNVRDLAEQYLYKQLETDAMTPEERQQRSDNEELTRRRTEEKTTREANETKKNDDQQAQYRTEFTSKIKGSLEESGVPVTDWTISRMAGYMRQAVSKGLDSSPQNLIKFVKQDWVSANRDFFTKIGDTDELINVLGDDTMNRIRKHQVAKYKSGEQKPAQTVANPEPRAPQREQYSSVEEMREAMLK